MNSVLADIWSIVRFYGRNIVRNTAQNLISCAKSVAKTLRDHYRYERSLGIRTTGYAYRKKDRSEATAFGDDGLYEPTGYEQLARIAVLLRAPARTTSSWISAAAGAAPWPSSPPRA